MNEVVRHPLARTLVASHEPAFEAVKQLSANNVTYRDMFNNSLNQEQQFLLLQVLSFLSERKRGARVDVAVLGAGGKATGGAV